MARVFRAKQDLKKIVADWSKETKQKITEDQLKQGNKLIEHELVDDFDLVLWENNSIPTFPLYLVSLNTGQFDPFEEQTVQTKIPADRLRKPKEMVNHMVDVLDRWINRYGRLAIGSFSQDKFYRYLQILVPELVRRGIEIEHINAKNPEFGVFIHREGEV